ncbi:uncharacterized protein FFNC_15491 [Fusarium fujikuroi]|nr:uncharacterized protein FFNC_15491 [Fusarium fujikuroi]
MLASIIALSFGLID